ncbi:transporter substrate-binding domain-containing protein, partial [Pseudomonas chlororaphis]|uniref:transporter substrate-binding domain-containing protein n=1 Tax=Pseudomonas chlororaphis TaxID=587753 RepID=UPI001FF0BE6A
LVRHILDGLLGVRVAAQVDAVHGTRLPVKEGAKVGPTLSLAIPFQKGNPAFQASLDGALQRIKADGRLMALSEKWFGMDASKPPKP